MPHPALELWIMSVFGSLGGVLELLDHAIFLLLNNDLLKGVPFAAALFLLWAVPRPQHADGDREAVLYIVLATILSLVIGRIVQNMFQSPRPLMVPEIAAMFPPTFSEYRLDWNTFPSDHMALYFAIALGVYGVRRPLGMALIGWSLVGVGLPRIYAGYHYPLDILGGMAVAAASLVLVWQTRAWLQPLCAKVLRLAVHYPTLAMSAAFILCFQIATVFNTARELGEFGRTSVRLLRTALLH
jgi:membrane-associated phospholipid phosphatase